MGRGAVGGRADAHASTCARSRPSRSTATRRSASSARRSTAGSPRRSSPPPGSDALLLLGVRGEVQFAGGHDRPRRSTSRRARFYKAPDHDGKVCLVLGAGNINSIPPIDVATKLFNEGKVCLLKMNPVNAYLGPLFEEAFAEAIARGLARHRLRRRRRGRRTSRSTPAWTRSTSPARGRRTTRSSGARPGRSATARSRAARAAAHEADHERARQRLAGARRARAAGTGARSRRRRRPSRAW